MPNHVVNTLLSGLALMVFQQLGYPVTREIVNQTTDAIVDIFGSYGGETKPPPEPLDIRDFSADLAFDKDPIANLSAILSQMKFATMKNVKVCELYENVDHKTLLQVIDLIGANNSISHDQIGLMKLSTGADRVIRDAIQCCRDILL